MQLRATRLGLLRRVSSSFFCRRRSCTAAKNMHRAAVRKLFCKPGSGASIVRSLFGGQARERGTSLLGASPTSCITARRLISSSPHSSSSASSPSVAAAAHRESELQRNLDELEQRGFTIVKDIFSSKEIETLKSDFNKLIHPKAMNIIRNTPAKPRAMEENDTAVQSMYWKPDKDTLILQAGKGRYDFYKGFGGKDDGMFGTAAVLRNPRIHDIVKRLLVKDFTSYTGVIHNTVGSEDQYWHRDTDTLSNVNTDGKHMVLLDDFYFTCLVPITVPINMANGATEFIAGSHRKSANEFSKLKSAQAEVPLGSALLFNGKANHRGKANNSSEDRPVIYTVFHKLWYNDGFRRGVE